MTTMAKVNHTDLRTQVDLRDLINKYVHHGWSIETRDPTVVISRGRIAKYVDFGCLKDGRPQGEDNESHDRTKAPTGQSGRSGGESKAIL